MYTKLKQRDGDEEKEEEEGGDVIETEWQTFPLVVSSHDDAYTRRERRNKMLFEREKRELRTLQMTLAHFQSIPETKAEQRSRNIREFVLKASQGGDPMVSEDNPFKGEGGTCGACDCEYCCKMLLGGLCCPCIAIAYVLSFGFCCHCHYCHKHNE